VVIVVVSASVVVVVVVAAVLVSLVAEMGCSAVEVFESEPGLAGTEAARGGCVCSCRIV
jgi:hypothetical protein